MKSNKMILMGLVAMSMVTTTNAAVLGTAKNDIQINLTENEIITKQAGDSISIIDEKEGNYLVNILDTHYFVNKQDINVTGVVTKTTTNETKLREAADPTADIIQYLGEGTLVAAIERQDDFYKVEVNGTIGYIYKGQLNETGLENLTYNRTDIVIESTEKVEKTPVEDTVVSKGEEIVAYAKKFLGGKYVYGGNSLTSGVDCSGFTQQIMKKFGINIERSSRAQYASNGYKVSKADIMPGDLVFYGANGRTVDHVAIYAGNGQIIHASDAKSGIKMSALNYGKPLIGIKRVVK